MKTAHLLYVPLLGLGLYGGHRGKRWLKNRIKIFRQFVFPSLKAQTNQNFILWVSVRYEDRNDPLIAEFKTFLEEHFKTVFTYSGICFWDDKYEDKVAYQRLSDAIHGAMGDLLNTIEDAEEVLMTIQPSDDCYYSKMVEETQDFFSKNKNVHVFGYKKGYVMDYLNRRLAEWNPTTTPPFYTIRFRRETFADPFQHMKYTGPYKSHEYVKDFLPTRYVDTRGFIVGTHDFNISTVFQHPFRGHEYLGDNIDSILNGFGLRGVDVLKIPFSLRATLFRLLPYKVKRKLRFLATEKKWLLRPLFALLYNLLRA